MPPPTNKPLLYKVMGATPKERRRRARTLAITTSIVVHVAFFLAAFSSSPGSTFSGGVGQSTGDERAIVVALEGLQGLPTEFRRMKRNPEQTKDARLNDLFRKISAEHSEIAQTEAQAPEQEELSKLFEEINQQYAKDDSDGKASDASDEVGDGGKGKTEGQAKGATNGETAENEDSGGGASNLENEKLWGQVAPCWRKIPEASAVPVILEVALNDLGLIASPPRIVRPASGPINEKRLIAEARALTAVAACVPYRPGAPLGTRKTYRLTFMPVSAR
jgi:hypothetical protein